VVFSGQSFLERFSLRPPWRRRQWSEGAGDQHPRHDGEIADECVGRLHPGVWPIGAVDRHLDAARKLLRRHAARQRKTLLAADPLDRRRTVGGVKAGIFLVEVARLQQMFGEQLLDMGRTVERGDELLKPRGNSGDQDIGQAAAGLFLGARRRDSAASARSCSRSITARNSASLDLKWW